MGCSGCHGSMVKSICAHVAAMMVPHALIWRLTRRPELSSWCGRGGRAARRAPSDDRRTPCAAARASPESPSGRSPGRGLHPLAPHTPPPVHANTGFNSMPRNPRFPCHVQNRYRSATRDITGDWPYSGACSGLLCSVRKLPLPSDALQEGGARLEGEEDGGAEEKRGLADGLGGMHLRRSAAGRVAQQRHPQVQRNVIRGRDLVCACAALACSETCQQKCQAPPLAFVGCTFGHSQLDGCNFECSVKSSFCMHSV